MGAKSLQSTTGPLTGEKDPRLGEKPCACKAPCQWPCTATSGSVPPTSHHTNREETPSDICQATKSPSIHQVSPSPFSHRALVAEGRHTSFLGAPWGSQVCTTADMQNWHNFIWIKLRRNSVDHPKQYQIEISMHFGVSKEHNFIKHARPNKHKKEITRHCHNRKYTKVLPKLELAGKSAIVRNPFQARILLITLSKHGIMAKKTPNQGDRFVYFVGSRSETT